MKKNRIVVLLLSLIILGNTISVKAEPSEDGTYTHGDYKIKINGIKLNVYKMEKDPTSSDDSVLEEDNENFMNKIPTRTYNLESTDYTINPDIKDTKMSEIDTLLINLNLNITNEKLKTILQQELSETTENLYYVTDIVASYQLIQYPDKFNHFYDINLFRDLDLAFVSSSKPKEVTITEEQNQVFNMIVTNINEETDEKELIYETKWTEENNLSLFILNYLALSTEEITSWTAKPQKIIMFHSLTNMDDLISSLSEAQNGDDNNDDGVLINPSTSMETDDNKNQVIKTPNTALETPTYMYIISISCIIIGLGTMGVAFYREKRNVK